MNARFMNIRVEQRIAVYDGHVTQYIYVGDWFVLLRKDDVSICGMLVSIESDTIVVKQCYGDRTPLRVKVADIKTMYPDNAEQGGD